MNDSEDCTKVIRGIIREKGNGFPDIGDFVPGNGFLFQVMTYESPIQTSRDGNFIHAKVKCVDWYECEEGKEFPASVETREGIEVSR